MLTLLTAEFFHSAFVLLKLMAYFIMLFNKWTKSFNTSDNIIMWQFLVKEKDGFKNVSKHTSLD